MSRARDLTDLERAEGESLVEYAKRIDWTKCPLCGGTGIVPELRGAKNPFCTRCDAGKERHSVR